MAASVRVEANGPWDHRAALTSLLIHAVDGLEIADTGGSLHRRLLIVGGEPHPVLVRLDPDGVGVETGTRDEGALGALADRVRDWFDLATDIDAVDGFFREDPILGGQVGERPGIRVTGFTDGFEAAAMTVVGQQVSLAAARQYGSRLVAAYGEEGPEGLRLFPDPGTIAALEPDALQATLRTTGARTRTLQSVAELFAEGFRLDRSVDPAAARETLLAVTGIGPWTADYLAIRATSDPDAFPSSDAVLLRALGRPGKEEAERIAEVWRPWRTYAAMRLWAGQTSSM